LCICHKILANQVFAAHRGPLGAILLLFRTKGRSLAALGAILIVLLLAIDTFFQQVVVMSDQWTLLSVSGTLPRVTTYNPNYEPIYQHGIETTSIDRYLANTEKDFLYGNGTQAIPFGIGTRPEIPLTCPSSNCTWPPYETLAVCSNCADVSNMVDSSYACLNTTIDWSAASVDGTKVSYPNGTVCGYFLNATSSSPTLLSGYILPLNGSITSSEALIVRAIPLTDFDTKKPYYGSGSIKFKDASFPILDALIATAKDGPQSIYDKEPPVVLECMLTWCVRTLKSSYDSGIYHEEILSTYIEPALPTDHWPWEAYETEYGTWMTYYQQITLNPPHPRPHGSDATIINESYQVSNQTQANIMYFFDDFFPSFYTAANISAPPTLRFQNYQDNSSVRKLSFNPWQYPNNITRHMERMASAMTNTIRSSASNEMIEGKAYQREPYVTIQWGWLAFPIVLLILTLVFLISTIIRTSGDGATGIWKTSAMPTLIYSLPKEAQSQFTSSAAWGSEKGAPRKMRIKLLPDRGWRISGQSYLSRSPKLPLGESVPRGWI
jgi:hypothetical protein